MFEEEFFKKIRKLVGEMEKGGETIGVKGSGGSQVGVRRIRESEDREIKGTLETEYLYLERPWEIIFCMHVPGVERERVEVRRRGRAIEVVARRRDGKAYFSTFELPPKAVPEERTLRLKEGLLLLIIPKRRR